MKATNKHPAFTTDLALSSELLIQAGAGGSDVAAAAWDRWQNLQQPGEGPAAAERMLLPTVAWNLQREVPSASLGRALESRRSAARSNLVAVAKLQHVLNALARTGVVPFVLKGGALLSSACYGDLAARRMSDLDLLVDPNDALRAIACLETAGQVRYEHNITPLRLVRSVMHAALLDGPLGEIDLHWTLLHHSRHAEADQRLRATAERAVLGTLDVLVPNSTQLAFHVLAHGRLPDLRWLVDIRHVLARGQVDVQELAEIARDRRYLCVVTANARILVQVLPSSATHELVSALEVLRPRPNDRLHTEHWDISSRTRRARSFASFARSQMGDRQGKEKVEFLRDLTCFSAGTETMGKALGRMATYGLLKRRRTE